jgi:hypothetical protein
LTHWRGCRVRGSAAAANGGCVGACIRNLHPAWIGRRICSARPLRAVDLIAGATARSAQAPAALAAIDREPGGTVERLRHLVLLERVLERADYAPHDDEHVCQLCDVPACRAGEGGCPVDRGAGTAL